MDVMTLLLQMISGAAGGNLVANQLKMTNMGSAANSIAGMIGGGIGSQILSSLFGLSTAVAAAPDAGGIDLASVVSMMLTGAAGGGVMTMIMGWLTRATAR
jgi:uncharacterized membrane protein YeaQ/YmgE (transglycosylase-associated protein family)